MGITFDGSVIKHPVFEQFMKKKNVIVLIVPHSFLQKGA